MRLVSGVREKYGLEPAFRALGLPRSTWYYHTTRRVTYAEKYAHLRGPLEAIARAPGVRLSPRDAGAPGDTRAPGEPKGGPAAAPAVGSAPEAFRKGSEAECDPTGDREIAGPRANLLVGRHKSQIGPLEVLYTDFTELVYADGVAKASLIPILDHTTKLVAGFAVGEGANSVLALPAWSMAKSCLAVWKASLEGVVVHHDQDPVFTGYAWTGRLLADGVRISYALRGARENPEMESFFGRFKVENNSLLLDAVTLEELKAVVAGRIQYYNRERRHSSLGDRPPLAFIEGLYREG